MIQNESSMIRGKFFGLPSGTSEVGRSSGIRVYKGLNDKLPTPLLTGFDVAPGPCEVSEETIDGGCDD